MDARSLVVTRSAMRDEGLRDDQIDNHLRRGRWVAVRRGVLAPRTTPRADPDVEVAAVVAALSRDVVVSHAHAARLWGLPSPLGGWPPLTVTAGGGPTRRRDGIHLVVAPCPDEDIDVDTHGLPVTTMARTVADCLRTLPPPDALAIADAALRGELSVPDLACVMARQKGWPGIVVARRVAGLADPRRESPLESWSAWSFDLFGVPQPTWQVDLRDAGGWFCGRVDGWWKEGVAGESDGKAKALLAAAERGGLDASTLAKVLDDERRREQRIRRTGCQVVRWGAGDVRRRTPSAALAAHLVHELATARTRSPFTGSARPARQPSP
ncbi:MAG: hypothetical protein WAL50_19040 [Kineosporiaceae bacterium]